jgi:hypothetical protein
MIDPHFEKFEKENPCSMIVPPLAEQPGGTELAKACNPRRGSIGQSSSEKGVSNEEPSSQKYEAHTARFHTD